MRGRPSVLSASWRGTRPASNVPNVLNDPVVRRHRVVVGGLDPDTLYRYALGDGTPQGWGPWKTVKTAPAAGHAVRFLYLGDAQTGLQDWGRLSKAQLRRHPRMDFVVLAGDLVDRGNERTNWDHFFLRAAPVFDRLPVMPCVGNHEYLDVGPRLYRAFFELPRNGPRGIDPDLAYSFEAGDACFAVMDSTLAVWDPEAARRQAEWLDRTLSRTKARWKIAIFHHPVYPAHPGATCRHPRALGPGLRQAPRQPRPPGSRPLVSTDLSAPRAPTGGRPGTRHDLRDRRLGRQVR